MPFPFSITFLTTILLTLGLFGAAEIYSSKRQPLAAAAAIVEGIVFLQLAYVLGTINWNGIPSAIFGFLPIPGTLFAWRLAYRRLKGMEV